MGQGQGPGGSKPANAQIGQKRIRATEQQRDQLRSCDRLADKIRKQARTMAKNSGKNPNVGQITQQQSHIRNQISEMEREHDRLMNGLDAGQKQAWQEQIRNMSQLRQQLNQNQQQLAEELRGNPDANHVSERAWEMERTMAEWRKQYALLNAQIEF